nr:MAG TPA: Lysin motif [Caudoviricetes sp.]
MMKRRIRWGRVVAAVAVPLLIIGSIVTADVFDDKTEIIEYHKEVAQGETLYDICREIATDKEDLMALVHQAMKDNHITDPATLQPGQLVIVRVREARQ